MKKLSRMRIGLDDIDIRLLKDKSSNNYTNRMTVKQLSHVTGLHSTTLYARYSRLIDMQLLHEDKSITLFGRDLLRMAKCHINNFLKHYPDSTLREVIHDYRNAYKLSWTDIAPLIGYTPASLLKLIKKLGVRDNKTIYSKVHPYSKRAMDAKAQNADYDDIRHAISSMRLNGMKMYEIAAELDISQNTVLKYCPRHLRAWLVLPSEIT